jgi:regulator of replication initiation timing
MPEKNIIDLETEIAALKEKTARLAEENDSLKTTVANIPKPDTELDLDIRRRMRAGLSREAAIEAATQQRTHNANLKKAAKAEKSDK